MRFRVNELIYFYMILLACMFAYNIYYVAWRRIRNRKMEKRIRRWEKSFQELLESEKDREAFFLQSIKTLKSAASLEAFDAAAGELEPGQREQLLELIRQYRKQFDGLIIHYSRRSAVYKAYLANFMGKYDLVKDNPPAVRYMLETVLEPSVYCRENGLRALYQAGDKEQVVKVFHLFSREHVRHSVKLIADGLLEYAGDKEALAERLMETWDEYLPQYQVAFIDFFRMAGCGDRARILAFLCDETQERDIRFACIRYFRKVYYLPAKKPLQEIVRNWTDVDWEFPAVAALSLENFPGEETKEVLLDGICSSNWYIRFNCASALETFTDAEEIRKAVHDRNDVYAEEIYEYRREAAAKALKRRDLLKRGEQKV